MLVLALPQTLIDQARPAVERQFARRPDGWIGLGARGKLRRFEGDRAGLVDLQAAGRRYLEVFGNSNPDLLVAANLYRLAADAQAEPLLHRLRDDLTASVAERGPDGVRNGALVYVHFLLGADQQCQQAWQSLAAADPRSSRGTGYGPVARLAEARATKNLVASAEAIDAFEKGAAKERGSATDPSGPNWYDWLEVALVVQYELSGELSPRLREI